MPARNADPLTVASLSSRLVNTLFGDERNVRHFQEIGSTNTTAMQAAVQGALEGSVFVADKQIAGRGRGGHSWHSENGSGIYLSVVLRPKLEPSAALALSLIAGIAVHEALQRACNLTADLRWPNDVLLGSKKIAGVLTETSADMQRMHHAVVGIGINVNHSTFPPHLAGHATSLRIETGREWPRIEIIVALLESLDRQYRGLQSEPAAATARVIAEFEQRSSLAQGAMVAVHDREEAAVLYSGVTLGLDDRGFLRVQTPQGTRTVLSGGIRKVSATEGI